MQESAQQAIIRGLREIIDYAGLFPPAALAPQEAVAEYLQQRADPSLAWLFKRFVLPLSREQELRDAFENQLIGAGKEKCVLPVTLLLPRPDDEAGACALLSRVEVMLNATAPGGDHEAHRRVLFDVEMLEWQLPDLGSQAGWCDWPDFRVQVVSLLGRWPGLRLFVEQTWAALSGPESDQVVEKMADLHHVQSGFGLKIRTGGLVDSSVPPILSLAELIHRVVGAGLPFKCTAGLHAALREVSPRFGFEMHGFLNVVVAVAAAADGADVRTLSSILQAPSTAGLFAGVPRSESGAELSALGAALLRARKHFASFGSCSVKEPYESLVHHGLVVNGDQPIRRNE